MRRKEIHFEKVRIGQFLLAIVYFPFTIHILSYYIVMNTVVIFFF